MWFGTYTDYNMPNSMVMLTFHIFDGKYLCWVNLVQKIKIFSLSPNLILRLIRIWRIHYWCSFFLFLTGSILFGVKFGPKIKTIKYPRLSNILDYIKYVKFGGDDHFSSFETFFPSFVPKIHLAFWYYLINIAAVYSQRLEASGFPCYF